MAGALQIELKNQGEQTMNNTSRVRTRNAEPGANPVVPFFRLLVALVAIFSALCGRAYAADRQNVLFLISDDLNNSLGCYGHPKVKTPNLDRLAERGVRFEHAYCQFPLCGPSRNSMLTGLHPNSTGILSNSQIFRQTIPSHHSLPQAFRLGGYFAGRIGKLYHYNVPKSVGTNGHDDPGSWELELNPAGCDRLEEEPHIFSLTPGRFGGTLSWYASPRAINTIRTGCSPPMPSGYWNVAPSERTVRSFWLSDSIARIRLTCHRSPISIATRKRICPW
jgi:hypothetical protein